MRDISGSGAAVEFSVRRTGGVWKQGHKYLLREAFDQGVLMLNNASVTLCLLFRSGLK
jgi:hypothetical protein